MAGIETEANKYIHPLTHPASMITEQVDKRFMTDANKAKVDLLTNFTHVQCFPKVIVTARITSTGGIAEQWGPYRISRVDHPFTGGYAIIHNANNNHYAVFVTPVRGSIFFNAQDPYPNRVSICFTLGNNPTQGVDTDFYLMLVELS